VVLQAGVEVEEGVPFLLEVEAGVPFLLEVEAGVPLLLEVEATRFVAANYVPLQLNCSSFALCGSSKWRFRHPEGQPARFRFH